MNNLRSRVKRLEGSTTLLSEIEKHRQWLLFLDNLDNDDSTLSGDCNQYEDVTMEEAQEDMKVFWRKWNALGLPPRNTNLAPAFEDCLLWLE